MPQSDDGKLHSAEEVFDQLNQRYEDAFISDHGLVRTVAKLITMLPPNAKVLDAGCGTGKPVSAMLAAAGCDVYGFDVSQEMVHLAQKNVPSGHFAKANMNEYRPDVKFDAILTIFSLFQIPFHQARKNLVKFRELLRPNGIYVVGTIGGEHFVPDSTKFDPEWGYLDNHDSTFMGIRCEESLITTTGWHKLLEKSGFDIASSEMHMYKKDFKNQPPDAHLFITSRKGGYLNGSHG